MTDRENLLLAQALMFTIEVLRAAPETQRPESNIRDMQEMLNSIPQPFPEMAIRQVDDWLILPHLPAK
jgi:hypothetical protein